MARNLAGSPDYLSAAGVANYTGEFSIAFWMKPSSVDNSVIIWKGSFNASGYYAQFNRSAGVGSLGFVTNQSGAAQGTETASGTFSTGTWQHIAITRSGATVKIYKDGVEASYSATGSHTDPDDASGNDFQIGKYAGAGFYATGDVAEFGTWGVALSAAEVASLAAGYSPSLVATHALDNYWPLIGRESPEPNRCGVALTLNDSPPQATHPRVIYPRRRPTARNGAAAPAITIPRIVHHRKMQGIA